MFDGFGSIASILEHGQPNVAWWWAVRRSMISKRLFLGETCVDVLRLYRHVPSSSRAPPVSTQSRALPHSPLSSISGAHSAGPRSCIPFIRIAFSRCRRYPRTSSELSKCPVLVVSGKTCSQKDISLCLIPRPPSHDKRAILVGRVALRCLCHLRYTTCIICRVPQ